MIDIDVVIPSYAGYTEVKNLIESFKNQRCVNIVNIVLPITKSNFGNDYNLELFCKKNNLVYYFIEKKEFSHSLVRENAIMKYCKSDIVILITQDVKLYNDIAIYNLVKDILLSKISYTFGRQICSKKKCIERYIRDFNYPNTSYIASKSKIEKHQIKAFFASDVFAALDRKLFIKLNGYDGVDVCTNEDMLYMYKLITKGYNAKYCSDAIVEHFHKYSFKSLYNRYFNTGRFFKKMKIFDKYNKTGSGRDLAFYVLKKSIKCFDIPSLFKWLPNMAIRFIGMKRGLK